MAITLHVNIASVPVFKIGTVTPPACTDIESATRIFNSSTAVVHLIDKPLLYTKELSDAYNEISGN